MLVQIKACYFDNELKKDIYAGELFEYVDENRANTLIEAGVAFIPNIQKVEANAEDKPKTKPKKEVKKDE